MRNILVTIFLFIILILVVNTNVNIEYYKNTDNIRLAIQSVFLPYENVYFLEEWIKYHLDIGFDKIYLYDNIGSIGADGSKKNTSNKYNINYSKIFNDTDHIKNEYSKILNKYSNNVVHIRWQPRNEKNEITYGQGESIKDYIDKYRNENDWTAFIDVDEFIILNSDEYTLKDFIKSKQKEDINKIIIKQNKMEDRFCQIDKSIYDITNSIDINTDGWGPKNICKNLNIISNNHHIHNISLNNEKSINMDNLYFNHYNVNKKQIDWMKNYFKKDSLITKKDNSLNKHKEKLCDLNLLSNRKYDKNYFKILKRDFCFNFN